MNRVRDKILAWLLTIMMIFQLVPAQVYAETADDWQEIVSNVETADYWTVHFMSEGEEVTKVYVEDGKTIDRFPDAPVLEGKTFQGWFVDGERVSEQMVISADTVVEALYAEVEEVETPVEEVKPEEEPTEEPAEEPQPEEPQTEETPAEEPAEETEEPAAPVFEAGTAVASVEGEYSVTVSYGPEAQIPSTAKLSVTDIPVDAYEAEIGKALELGEEDVLDYTRALKIAFKDENGAEINPAADVDVEVTLSDVEEGAAAMQVIRIDMKGDTNLAGYADQEGLITFKANSSDIYAFANVLWTDSWTTGEEAAAPAAAPGRRMLKAAAPAVKSNDAAKATYKMRSFVRNRKQLPTYTKIDVANVEEGVEVINAYAIGNTEFMGSLNTLKMDVSLEASMDKRENVEVYSVVDGELGELLGEGKDLNKVDLVEIDLTGAEAFALVRDTGMRNLTLEAEAADVSLSGMLPKEATVTADNVVDQYAELGGEEASTLVAYDITIHEEDREFQPESDRPINVAIADASLTGVDPETVHVYHINDDGTQEEVTDFVLDGTTISFTANGFSVYAVVGVLKTEYIDAKGNLYEVTVTYTEEAQIPEGSWLRVTEFEEGTEDYENALKAWIADKEARGEEVNLWETGFAALDISIINPEGVEIEPAAPVTVDMKIKALPGVEDLSAIDNIQIQHHVEVEDGVVLETVYTGNLSVNFKQKFEDRIVDGEIVVSPSAIDTDTYLDHEYQDIRYDVEKFSTFTITWYYGYREVTIHYGYMNNNTFVEFTESPAPVNVSTNYYAHLIYDFEDYQYYRTYYSNNATSNPTSATRIGPLLRYSSNNWQYKTVGNSIGNWSNLTSGRHIYVVYEPKVETTGGTPKPSQDETWPDEEDDLPNFYKSSTNNGDGTNTISLSIKAAEKVIENKTKANVIVAFDVSGSMDRDMNGNETSQNSRKRLTIAKSAVNALANTLLSNDKVDAQGNKLVKLALIKYSDTASIVQDFTDQLGTYQTAVNQLSADGGTNWEGALALANSMANADSDAVTFVIFVTDGDPTVRMSRGNITDATLNSQANDWRYRDVDDGDEYYVRYGIYGTGTHDNFGRNYDYAVEEVASIVEHNKNFYAIGVSNDVTKVRNLVSDGGGQKAFIATNTQELTDAFEEIAQSITSSLGFGDVAITDGITEMTSSEMKVMQEVDPDSFSYYVYGGTYNGNANNMVPWDPTAHGCYPASYDKTSGTVHWNMGSGFQLEDGVTYVVTFKVWPSQEAYDLVADLNNGVKVYAAGQTNSITEEERLQVEELAEPTATTPGSYALKTNTNEINATYKKTTKTGDVVTVSDQTTATATYHEGTIQNMALSTSTIAMRKDFQHDIFAPDLKDLKVQFYLIEDGHKYPSDDDPEIYELNPGNNWKIEGLYIAPGLMQISDGSATVLSHGHQYTLQEVLTGTDSYNYEFIPMTVHPMVTGVDSDGKPIVTMLILKDDKYYTNPDHATEYTIDGKTYYIGGSDNTLIGTNYKTAEIDFTKQIVDETGKMTEADMDAESFTYEITLTVPAGKDATGIRAQEWVPRLKDAYNGTNRIYIDGYQGEAGTSTPYAEDATRFKDKVYGRYYSQVNQAFASMPVDQDRTVTFYMTLARDEVIRITSLPSGTTYSIKEVGANVSEADSSANAGAPITSFTVPADGTPQAQGYTVTSKSAKGTASGDTISGTIEDLDTRYYNVFTNTLKELNNRTTAEIKVKKVVEGYEWGSGYYNFRLTAGIATYADGTEGVSPMPQGNSTDTDGKVNKEARIYDNGQYPDHTNTFEAIKFTKAGTYTYTLKETWVPTGVKMPGEVTLTVTVAQNGDELSVTEITASGDGSTSAFTYTPASAGQTATMLVTFTNRMTSTVKVTKSFSGVDVLPAEFKITNDYNDTEFTVATASGAGTEDDPYTWTIAGVPVNTKIVFTETGNTADHYDLTAKFAVGTGTEQDLPADGKADQLTVIAGDAAEDENVIAFTNTYVTKTKIKVEKIWDDSNNQDGKRGNVEATIQLYAKVADADAAPVGTPVTVTTADDWSYTWTDLSVYSNGTAIKYYVVETMSGTAASEYTKSGDGEATGIVATETDDLGTIKVKNSYTPETTSLVVKKIWDDNSNQDGKRAAVKLVLTGKDGEEVIITKDFEIAADAAGNEQTQTFTVPVKANGGHEITYTVDEETVPAEYTKTVDNENLTVTNTHTQDTVSVVLTKTWNDANDPSVRPTPAEFASLLTLKADGTTVTGNTPTATANGNKYTVTWSGLTQYRTGKVGELIVYTVEEAEIKKTIGGKSAEIYTRGKITPVSGNAYAYEVTNTRKTLKSVSLQKMVEGNMGDRTKEFVFSVRISQAGSNEPINTTVDRDNWTYDEETGIWTGTLKHTDKVVFSDLPIGAKVEIVESDAEHYKTSQETGELDWKTISEGDNLTYSFTVPDADKCDVLYRNYRSVEIDTGVRTDVAPYAILMGLAAGAGAVMFARRRRRRIA